MSGLPPQQIPVKPVFLFSLFTATIVCAIAWPLFSSDTVFVGSGGDAVSAVLPHLEFIARALQSGRIPLWNPHIFTGIPELAGAQWGVLYPFETILLPLIGAPAYLSLTLCFHMFLVAVFGYLLTASWLRATGFGPMPVASAVGGTGIAFSGFVSGHIFAGHVGIVQSLPWMVLMGYAGVECVSGRFIYSLLLSIAVALSILAGGIHVLPFGLLSAFAVWVVAAKRNQLKKAAFLIIAGLFLGLFIAAIQIIPVVELALNSARSHVDLRPAPQWVLHDISELVFKDFSKDTTSLETSAYVGPVAVFLALIALVFRDTRKKAFLMWALVVIFILLAGPIGVYVQLALPGLSLLRVPARSLLGVDILLPLLAALAIASIQGRLHGRWVSLLLLGGVAAFGIFTSIPAFWTAERSRPSMTDDLSDLFVQLTPNFRAVSVLRPSWNVSMKKGWLHLGGYEPLAPLRTALLTKTLVTGDPYGPWSALYAIYPPHEEVRTDPRWGAFAVRLIMSRDGIEPLPDMKLLHAEGGFALWENLAARPRARFVACPKNASSPEDALKFLSDEPTNDFIETHMQLQCAPSLAKVRMIRDDPEELEIEVDASGQGWLVVADLAYPGWEASVDGQKTGILPANCAARAIAVPKGRHVIKMWFDPLSFRIGAFISLAALLVLIVIFMRWLYQHFHSRSDCAIRHLV